MSFGDILNSLLNEDKLSEIEVNVVDLPLLNIDERIEDARNLWSQSVKKMEKTKLVKKDKSEGFFFHYNPVAKKYYESNASFQFMFFAPPAGASYSPPPKVNEYWNHFVFEVDHKEKKVSFEKQFQDNKIRNYFVDSADINKYKIALQKVISRHPEIEQYKFVGMKNVKTVEDFLGLDDIESIGRNKKVKIYIALTGYDAKKALQSRFNPETNYLIELTIDGATKVAKNLINNDISNTWAILSASVHGSSLEEGKYKNIVLSQPISKEDLKLEKTNDKEYMNREDSRKKIELDLDQETKEKISVDSAFILGKEEIEKFIASNVKSGRKTGNFSNIGNKNVFFINTKNGRVILADREKASAQNIQEVIASIIIMSTRYVYLDNSIEIRDLYKDPKKSYRLIFEGKAPKNSKFTKEIIEKIFLDSNQEYITIVKSIMMTNRQDKI